MLDIFLIFRYETTATLITFALYNLARNQDLQEKLHKILQESGEIDYNLTTSCTYLDAVIQETLRMYPPAAVMDREASEDYTLPGTEIVIPKGTDVQIPIVAIHMDPEFYPEPEMFDPERFMPENRDKLIPYTYLPFGAGPRNCIGMRFALLEAKLLLARMILSYRVSFTDKTIYPPKYVKAAGLLKFDPLLIRVETRS